MEVPLVTATPPGSHSLGALILDGQFPDSLFTSNCFKPTTSLENGTPPPYLLPILDFGTLNPSIQPITAVSVARKGKSPTSISLVRTHAKTAQNGWESWGFFSNA